MVVKFIKEEGDKSSPKKCIDYGFSDSATIFLNFTSHFNSTCTNTFNIIQEALKILCTSIEYPEHRLIDWQKE